MKKIITIFTIFTIILIGFSINSFAESKKVIIKNKEKINLEEQVEIKVELQDAYIAALTLEIYWDNTKLEYNSGPQNSNKVDNKVLYTWVSENGKNKQEIKIEGFNFVAKQEGITSIVVTGEFYNENGKKVEIAPENIEIKIGEAEDEPLINDINLQENQGVADNNSELAIMRLEIEGISPEFEPNVYDYYITTVEDIKNIKVTAIPKNKDATVTITGNDNLKNGENVIKIQVQSKDKSSTSNYNIFLTKTKNKETANANLETLAIRQGNLTPEFDANETNYRIEVPKETETIEILAIPQKQNASVKITGGENIKIGDNKIEIVVTAENGTTTKKYEVTVHRRNDDEEKEVIQEHEEQIEKLSTILDEKENQKENKTNNEQVKENKEIKKQEETKKWTWIGIGVVGVIIIVIIGIVVYKRRKKY